MQHHHAHAPVAERQLNNDLVHTVVSVVFVTAGPPSATPVASSRQVGAPLANTRASSNGNTPVPSYVSPTYTVPARHQVPTSSSAGGASTNVGSAMYQSAQGNQVSASLVSSTASSAALSSVLLPSSASSSPSSTAVPLTGAALDTTSNSSSGLSGGAKAGLAIGILLACGLLAALAFFCYRRKKLQKDDHQRLDDEKSALHQKSQSVSSHVSVRRSKHDAPRLSIRPMTQMFPAMAEKQDAGSLVNRVAKTPEPVIARSMSATSESSNPFDDQDAPVIATPAAVAYVDETPTDERTATGLSQSSPPTESQPFPTAVAGSRRNSPPGPGPDNVHRVQLDFKPSMKDELELRAGSLVRLLHEYDDGWALCIRLDRSQQGVVPRTCISKMPVKPRQGPPPNATRGLPPQARARGPSNAPAPRMAPNGRPMGPPNNRMRAQSNAPHQMQGGPQARPRSNSEVMSARRVTPPSVSPLSSPATSPPQAVPARKPVPGQAI